MKHCPDCKAPENKEQPTPSLHACTTVYECGYETTTVLGSGHVQVERKCPSAETEAEREDREKKEANRKAVEKIIRGEN